MRIESPNPDRHRWLWVGGIIALALVIRLAGISTESFWADEAFTATASQGSPLTILETNAQDIHPPAYYLGLSFWRALPPDSDAVIRGYSTLWSLLGILILILLARDIAGWRCALAAGLLAAVNPLDVYFAQEARMYSQATALGLVTSGSLWRWYGHVRAGEGLARGWRWAVVYGLAATLLLFTHYVAVTFLVGQGIVALLLFAERRAWTSVAAVCGVGAAVALVFLPWLLYVLSFRDSIVRVEGLEWMPVPGISDYFSQLGREYFWGRAHKVHDRWWTTTMILPLLIIGVGLWRSITTRWSSEDKRAWLFLAGLFIAPLAVCALVGASYQVIYYRPRYVVILLPYFLIVLAWSCHALGRRPIGTAAVAIVASLMLFGTVVQERTPQKRAWRETAAAWPTSHQPAFYVILPAHHQRPLAHYLGDHVRHTPRHVLEKLTPLPEGAFIWLMTWPEELSPDDAAYRDSLREMGDARHQLLPSYYSITQVEPRVTADPAPIEDERFRAWYRPFDIPGAITGFNDPSRFGKLAFDSEGRAYRWSAERAWLRLDDVAPGEAVVLRSPETESDPPPEIFLKRGGGPREIFALRYQPAPGSVTRWGSEIHVPAPPGEGPLWIGWKSRESESARSLQHDSPERGLRVEWVGVGRVGGSESAGPAARSGSDS
jgi:4-amino-4-deoxy-L-arabinose transferase-like glycosyltransferase